MFFKRKTSGWDGAIKFLSEKSAGDSHALDGVGVFTGQGILIRP
jgi:hypothetical protein